MWISLKTRRTRCETSVPSRPPHVVGSCKQIWTALIMAGRQVSATSRRTRAMADGVKGGLVARSPSFVVCAFRSVAASRSTWRGLGGRLMGVSSDAFGPVGDVREDRNCVRSVRVDARSWSRSCALLEPAVAISNLGILAM